MGGQLRLLSIEAGLGEDVLVVEQHHGVRLPGQLVEAAVSRRVLVRDVPGALRDIGVAIRELAQVDQAALFFKLGDGNWCRVEHEAGGVSAGDGCANDFFGALARGDLLRIDLLIRMLGVPGFHHGLAPGDLELVVGVPDLDGTLGGDGLGSAVAAAPSPAASGQADTKDCGD